MTTDYRAVPLRTGSLRLDPKNARLPSDRRSDNQRVLLHALLETEDVESLAKSIAKLGIFPNERLVVMQEGRIFYVLEGNRRLAAIKLLLNPDLAPTPRHVRAFRKLSDKADLQALGKLDVAIVKDRISAAPIIAALHIGLSKKSWSNLQQAHFYKELADQGQTPQEIANELGVSASQVKEFLRSELLHRVALTCDYTPELRSKIEHPKFPLTNLSRFIDSKIGRKGLGITINENGDIEGTVHPERFKAVLKRVVVDILDDKVSSRKVNKDSDFKRYFEEIEPDLPKTKRRGQFDPKVLLGEQSSLEGEKTQRPTRPRNTKPKKSSSIVPIGFPCTTRHDRVRAIFGELRSMKIENQRNSTGVMLRVLIDVAIWMYIVDKGLAEAVCDHVDKNRKKRNYDHTWTPPLRELINYMCDKKQFEGMDAAGYKAARLLTAKGSSDLLSLDGFNAFTHNPHVTPTEAELRELWQRAQPMLEIILN